MIPLLCNNCTHLAKGPVSNEITCAAFPQRIPVEILLNRHDHRIPFPGDHGMRYDPVEPLDLDPPDADEEESDGYEPLR